MRFLLRHHANAINNRAHRITKSTASTVISNSGKMRSLVKSDRLVSRIITSHIAFAAIDAHVLLVKIINISLSLWLLCLKPHLLMLLFDY